eukprot:13682865-Heterocapsa_arctica.AAC.1
MFSTGSKGTLELSTIPHLSSHAGVTKRIRGLMIEHMLKAHRIVFLNATPSNRLFNLLAVGDRRRRRVT